jgi:tRNA A-37 threonylcarbamoyl transferase component Bud32
MTQWNATTHRTKKFELYINPEKTLFKKATGRLQYRLEREIRALEKAQELGLSNVQKLVSHGEEDGTLFMITEYCGRGITRRLLPKDWRIQLHGIERSLDLLKDSGVYHNDVLIRNILVDGSTMTLIDFDMATFGKPDRRGTKRPIFNTTQPVIDKIVKKWRL